VSVEIRQKNPGWLAKLLKRYNSDSVLAVGYPASETGSLRYPDGTSVILVAAVNNFGSASRGIPPRPFMVEGAEPALEATAPIAAALIPALNAGRATVEDILGDMGPFAEAAFKEKLTAGPWEPNADSTKEAKGSDKPLEDTLLLRNSLTHVVRKA
jgi:hypothetical protein